MTKGLYLYKRNNGFWYVGQRQDNGKVKWTTTKCKDKPSALQYFRSFQPSQDRDRANYTISEYITLLKERVNGSLRESTTWQYCYALSLLQDLVGDKPIVSITVGDLELFKTERLKTTKPTSVNILLRALKSCLNRATKWELIDSNPMMKVSLNKIPKLPPRWLTKENFEDLLTAVDKDTTKNVDKVLLKDIFSFAVNTGLRLSEITYLRWHFVDFTTKQFTVANTWNFQTKSGKQRTLPMSKTIYDILKRQLARRYKDTTYVFQKPGGFPLSKDYLTHKFAHYRKVATLPETFHFHTMRHTFISWALMSGIDIFTVKEFAGHSDTSLIDAVYGHLSDHHKTDEMRKLDKFQKGKKN